MPPSAEDRAPLAEDQLHPGARPPHPQGPARLHAHTLLRLLSSPIVVSASKLDSKVLSRTMQKCGHTFACAVRFLTLRPLSPTILYMFGAVHFQFLQTPAHTSICKSMMIIVTLQSLMRFIYFMVILISQGPHYCSGGLHNLYALTFMPESLLKEGNELCYVTSKAATRLRIESSD